MRTLKEILNTIKSLKGLLSVKQKVLMIALLILLVITPVTAILKAQKQKELVMLSQRSKDFQALSVQYTELKALLEAFQSKASLTKPKGLIEETHSLFESIGLKKKLKSVKSLGTKEVEGSYIDETVEIAAEGLNLNEVVNVFYKIDKAPMMLSVRSFSLKRSFENPELLNLTVVLSLFVKK